MMDRRGAGTAPGAAAGGSNVPAMLPLGANRGLAAKPKAPSIFSRTPAAAARAQQQQKKEAEEPMKEFVLRMATSSKWNVARFNVPVDLTQWKRPLRTFRADEIKPTTDPAAPEATATAPTPAPAAAGGKQRPRNLFARPMYARNPKNIPLHLEDSDKEHAFIGRINKAAGDSSNFFLLVADVNAGEFKVIPTGDWYQFRAKRSFTPMSLEEAEEQLKQMEKQNGGRWAATGRKGKSEEKEDSEGRHEFADEDRFAVFGESRVDSDDEEKGAQESKNKKVKDEDGVDDKEDIDFIEQWDDDEGIGFEEEQPEETKERKGKMTSTGKQMKSLIKDLEGDEANIEDSDEESEEELEIQKDDEEEQDKASKEAGAKEKAGTKRKKGSTGGTTPTTSTTSSPPLKKAKVEPSQAPAPAAAAKPAEEPKKPKEKLPLSAESVKELLTRKGKMTTVQLINYFKSELSDPAKKAMLAQIIKSVAKIITPPGSDKKFLVLK